MISQATEHIQQKLKNDASGHDWWHIHRVWQNAKRIADEYPDCDRIVVELAAILHDIADWKDHNGDEDIGPSTAMDWLQSKDISTKQIEHIGHIIRHISFKGANTLQEKLSLEGQIVQDADRLDALGAIGIARTFAFGGTRGNLMHDPSRSSVDHRDKQSYYSSSTGGTTINHFYEKLLLLKDRMNTEIGTELAMQRHEFMKIYLERFYAEWEGKM